MNYAKAQLSADRQIAKFGKKVKATLMRRTVTGYNPATRRPVETDVTESAYIVTPDIYTSDDDKTSKQKTTRNCLLSAIGLTGDPKPGDELLVDGTNFEIVKVMPLRPASITVMYELEVAL